MRFLADEDFPGPVVTALRDAGHDVAWVAESASGARDQQVLALARDQQRILLTCDTDFGQLAFRERLPAECGIVLFRLRGSNPDSDNRRAVTVIQSRQDWAGQFAVVSDTRIRMRDLPVPGSGA